MEEDGVEFRLEEVVEDGELVVLDCDMEECLVEDGVVVLKQEYLLILISPQTVVIVARAILERDEVPLLNQQLQHSLPLVVCLRHRRITIHHLLHKLFHLTEQH